jgi:hypothetical protein
MTYSKEGVPMSGQCGYCKKLFSTSVEAPSDTGKATQDFYTAFLQHECSDAKGTDGLKSVLPYSHVNAMRTKKPFSLGPCGKTFSSNSLPCVGKVKLPLGQNRAGAHWRFSSTRNESSWGYRSSRPRSSYPRKALSPALRLLADHFDCRGRPLSLNIRAAYSPRS